MGLDLGKVFRSKIACNQLALTLGLNWFLCTLEQGLQIIYNQCSWERTCLWINKRVLTLVGANKPFPLFDFFIFATFFFWDLHGPILSSQIQTQDGWAGKMNATSVLSRPPLKYRFPSRTDSSFDRTDNSAAATTDFSTTRLGSSSWWTRRWRPKPWDCSTKNFWTEEVVTVAQSNSRKVPKKCGDPFLCRQQCRFTQ